MSGNDLKWIFDDENDGPDDKWLDTLNVAVDVFIFETIRLIDSMHQLDYARSARRCHLVEHVLAHTEMLAARQPETCEREESLARLHRMLGAARIVLAAAPRPSAAAIAAALGGDWTAWDGEADAWIAGLQRDDVPPPIAQRRRPRRDTQPDTPTALREAAAQLAFLAASSGVVPTADKTGTP